MAVNLLDIAKANGSDAVVGLIEETTKLVPELTIVPARTIRGIHYKTLIRTALPTTNGAFRSANAGSAYVQGSYENRIVETYTSEARWYADKAVADRYEDGAQAYIAMEANGVMQGVMQGLGAQFFYGTGTGGNSSGFPGLLQALDTSSTIDGASGGMVVDAGGTTASTGSSVWAVRFGPQDVQWVWGANGQFNLSDLRTESMEDTVTAGRYFDAYVQTLLSYPGLQVGSIQSIGRIKKLTADSGKGLTDSLLADLWAKFPAAKKPNVFFASRRSAMQLRKSRTVVLNATGENSKSGRVDVMPQGDLYFNGIPIIETDSILNTEALTL